MDRTKRLLLLLTLPLYLLGSATYAQGEDPESISEPTEETSTVEEAPAEADAAGALVTEGEKLFGDNCTQCHSIGEGIVVGPDLKDVSKKRENDWLKNWINNSASMVKAGDPDAVAIFEEFKKQEMTKFDFNDEDLNALIAFIDHRSANAIVTADEGEGGSGGTDARDGTEEEEGMSPLMIGIVALVLLVLAAVLLLMNNMLKNILAKRGDLTEDERELVDQKFDISYLWTAPWIRGVAIFIVVIWALVAGVDFLFGIGVQQGYAPKQPINFSHRIHAGSEADGGHEIDCNYCHTGVMKSKNANIPSPNICMNCHSSIKTESPEIQKIYRAVEENKPIEWVRIHNLQDFVFFSHAQHHNVGGIKCQECHGPIETMDVVEQHSELTMAWCVNCHKDTPLNTRGNGYYDELVAKHESLKGSNEPFTVKNNGGWECARCHY